MHQSRRSTLLSAALLAASTDKGNSGPDFYPASRTVPRSASGDLVNTRSLD
ncbi:hypothetical protein [Streptomyces siamensis]|uniref:Uncharacterized protein n=1 Tax=Streptomyces siamensis TaxID=1274986 RepID=A0ABP9JEL9_9ACTN